MKILKCHLLALFMLYAVNVNFAIKCNMCTTIFLKCWYILCYCKPNSKVNRKV